MPFYRYLGGLSPRNLPTAVIIRSNIARAILLQNRKNRMAGGGRGRGRGGPNSPPPPTIAHNLYRTYALFRVYSAVCLWVGGARCESPDFTTRGVFLAIPARFQSPPPGIRTGEKWRGARFIIPKWGVRAGIPRWRLVSAVILRGRPYFSAEEGRGGWRRWREVVGAGWGERRPICTPPAPFRTPIGDRKPKLRPVSRKCPAYHSMIFTSRGN